MKQQLQKISQRYEDVFQAEVWYGEAIMKKLDTLELKYLNKKLSDNSASIAQLVQHMLNWRQFVIEKLKGNIDFSIEMNSEQDWTTFHVNGQQDWSDLLGRLKESQAQIQHLLANQQDSLLTQQVPGKNYDYELMLEGIIQHDLYHFGQISFLYKILKSQTT